MYNEIDNTDFDWFDLEANEEMKDICGIDGLLADALMEQDRAEKKETDNEFCINFLKASGWLDNHDKQIRKEERINTVSGLLEMLKKDCMSMEVKYHIDCSLIYRWIEARTESMKGAENE